VPMAAEAQGTIEGTVTFWGDPGGGTQLEIGAHSSLSGPPDETVYVNLPSDSYSIPIADGAYYIAVLMARDGNFGEPRPEDVLVWYDADGDGEKDMVTVSGGAVTGIDVDLGFVYVDIDATGGNNGTSWDNAFTDLQDGINAAVSGVEVWVAEGTYVPGTNRVASFYPKMGVRVCGGFTGVETIRGERDWNAHPTILSGEIGTSSHSDNCYNVVNADSSSPTALLDGVIIEDGDANGGGNYNYGGGVRALNGGVTVANSILRNNHANVYGGGIATSNPGRVVIVNSSIIDNTSDWYGGGFYVDAASPVGSVAINCVFTGNSAVRGGAMAVEGQVWALGSEPLFYNLSLSGNGSSLEGGGLYCHTTTNIGNAPIQIHNSIFWANTGPLPEISVYGGSEQPVVSYSIVQGGFPGTQVLDVNPSFVDGNNGDLHLNLDSPAIDSGDSLVVPMDLYDADGNHWTDAPVLVDRDFNDRFVDVPYIPNTGVFDPADDPIDMGAYEAEDYDLIFYDHFEDGHTGNWDNVVGEI
jgi:hypothetical protein